MTSLNEYHRLFAIFKDEFNEDGLYNVIEHGKELVSTHLKNESKPEEYTKGSLIRPTFEYIFGCRVESAERIFKLPDVKRIVDYTIVTPQGTKYLVEAKPYNADLELKSDNGAVHQLKIALAYHLVAKQFKYGIATDGRHFIFVSSESESIKKYDIESDFDELYEILGQGIVDNIEKEEISKKFYTWYFALLYGGSYIDHDGKTHAISKKNCLISSISYVDSDTDRESIAQTIFDRLIFIRFLESKAIIPTDTLDHIAKQSLDIIFYKLKTLFFEVLNTPKKERKNVDAKFLEAEYLNGSLFSRTTAELKNPDYSVSGEIILHIIAFLNAFKFTKTNKKAKNANELDPEILGYIFEMSMNDTKRKGTGAFYTPKEITSYLSETTISKAFIAKSKDVLKSSNNIVVPEGELDQIDSIDTLCLLPSFMLSYIFEEIRNTFRICDPACGSGAFLLAAADTLLRIYKKIVIKTNINIAEIGLKRIILTKNIFGVDLNSSAVEIARLRLWLWLVESFKDGHVETLPNIDYNLATGNSILGYIDVNKVFSKQVTTLYDYDNEEKSASVVLEERRRMITKYRTLSSHEAHKMKSQIDHINKVAIKKLNASYFASHHKYFLCSLEEFESWNPLHWGFEFDNIFSKGGFDVIVGNPPYIDSEAMSKHMFAQREAYKKLFQSAKGNWDIFVLFVEQSFKLLSPTGSLGLIVPNKILAEDYASEIRCMMAHQSIVEIRDYSGVDVFKDADVYPITFIADRANTLPNVQLSVMTSRTDSRWTTKVDSKIFNESTNWDVYFAKDPIVPSIIFKMLKNKPLKDCAIVGGAATVNEAYEIKEMLKDGDFNPEFHFKFINTGTIDPFKSRWGLQKTKYIKLSFDEPIISKSDLLSKYPKRFEEASDNKIIIAGMATRIEAIYDTGMVLAGKSTVVIRYLNTDLKYLLGILNSELVSLYYRIYYNSKTMAGGYLNFGPPQVENIPIPICSKEQSEKIIELVDALNVNVTDELITSLNTLVNQLYGISDEELIKMRNSVA